eukprot:935681-Rhodomonas_salina.2
MSARERIVERERGGERRTQGRRHRETMEGSEERASTVHSIRTGNGEAHTKRDAHTSVSISRLRAEEIARKRRSCRRRSVQSRTSFDH